MEHPKNSLGSEANTPVNNSEREAAIEEVKEIMRKMIKAELDHPTFDQEKCELCRKEG